MLDMKYSAAVPARKMTDNNVITCLLCLRQLPPGSVDVEILHDATRREARGGA